MLAYREAFFMLTIFSSSLRRPGQMVKTYIGFWYIMVSYLDRSTARLNHTSSVVIRLRLVSKPTFIAALPYPRDPFRSPISRCLLFVVLLKRSILMSLLMEFSTNCLVIKDMLSFVGRKCLINSAIAGSLVHSMMSYKWPNSLIKMLEVAIHSYL